MHLFWRVKHIGAPNPQNGPYIFGHWHGDELLLLGEFSYRHMAVMASKSSDGDLMQRILKSYGYQVMRGSSTRGGGVGLLGLVDAVKKGDDASLAVDGPRGPMHQMKPGILKLAQLTQRPLVLGAASARWRFVFEKAWNKTFLPLPFTQCVIFYGEPIWLPEKLDEEEFEIWRQKLEGILSELKEKAERYCGHLPILGV